MQRLLSSARQQLPRAQQVWLPQLQRAGSYGSVRLFSAAGVDDDTHDDFKPQVKGGPSASLVDQIEDDIKTHDVFLYMKGIPEAPMCGFSNMACRILDAYGVDFGSRNVLSDPELREGIKQYTSWPTIPQAFIKGEFVGGADLLYEMHQSGELKKLLDGVAKKDE